MDDFMYGFYWGLGFCLACIVVSLCCGLILYLLVSSTGRNVNVKMSDKPELIKEEDADM